MFIFITYDFYRLEPIAFYRCIFSRTRHESMNLLMLYEVRSRLRISKASCNPKHHSSPSTPTDVPQRQRMQRTRTLQMQKGHVMSRFHSIQRTSAHLSPSRNHPRHLAKDYDLGLVSLVAEVPLMMEPAW